jgi:hypothetical protein
MHNQGNDILHGITKRHWLLESDPFVSVRPTPFLPRGLSASLLQMTRG